MVILQRLENELAGMMLLGIGIHLGLRMRLRRQRCGWVCRGRILSEVVGTADFQSTLPEAVLQRCGRIRNRRRKNIMMLDCLALCRVAR